MASYSRYLSDYPAYIFRSQKIIGPISSEPVPSSGSEVFASKIPHDSTEIEIFQLFSKVGNIFKLRLMIDSTSGKFKGYCYVTYTSPEEAQGAIFTLNNTNFNNKLLSVEKSFDNSRLFIGGIPDKKSKDDVWRELVKHGINNIVDVIMYRGYNDRAKNRGFVFVEFENHQKAAEARSNFKHLRLWGAKMVVDWSTPLPDVGEEVLNQVKILFLRNLAVTQRKEVFQTILFSVLNFMPIEKVFKFKDYAFVHFTTRSNAETAMKKLKEHYKGTNVEITWAVPQQYAPKKRHLRSLPRYFPANNNNLNLLCSFKPHIGEMFRSQLNISKQFESKLVSNIYSNTFKDSSFNNSSMDYHHHFSSAIVSTSTPLKKISSSKNCDNDSGLQENTSNFELLSNRIEGLSAIPKEYVPKHWIRRKNDFQTSDLSVTRLNTMFANLTLDDSSSEVDPLVMSVVSTVLDD